MAQERLLLLIFNRTLRVFCSQLATKMFKERVSLDIPKAYCRMVIVLISPRGFSDKDPRDCW